MANHIKQIMLLLTCMSSNAVATEELFLSGNQAYQAGNYQEALEQYERIADKGPAVWYNIGKCAEHLHDASRAYVSFERAKKGACPALYAAACACNGQEALTWQDRIVQYSANVSLFAVQIVLLCIWYLFLLTVLLARSIYKKIAGIFLGFFVLVLCVSYFVVHRDRSMERAVPCDSTIKLYAGPQEAYHTLCTFDTAHVVAILGEQDAWYKVRAGTTVGWVSKEQVELV